MHKDEAFWAAIVVAAGAGTRFGGADRKQYLSLAGKPVLRWSVEALLACAEIKSVVVVHPAGDGEAARAAAMLPDDARLHFVAGGATRTDSTANGVEALRSLAPTHVMIHDAARPGLSVAVVREVMSAMAEKGVAGAAPALAVADSLRRRVGLEVSSVERDGVLRVQTPQAFRYPELAEALTTRGAETFSDDLSIIERAGGRVVLTSGRHELMKITQPEDLAIVERLMGAQPSGQRIRVGNGFDVHAFAPGSYVTICGIQAPHTHALEGHSDADVGWHALTDAILGAIAEGDIGQHFPPSDDRWRGAASIRFLQHAAGLAAAKGFAIGNVDITIICERPKIGPHREAMRDSTAAALGIDRSCVSIKATTTEKLGFTGRGEGIAAQAVVLLTG